MFPHFSDVKGLILLEFSLMFGAEEKWNTSFKEIIQEAWNLKETALLKQHLKAVLNDDPDVSSKYASVYLHLLVFPPTPHTKYTHHELAIIIQNTSSSSPQTSVSLVPSSQVGLQVGAERLCYVFAFSNGNDGRGCVYAWPEHLSGGERCSAGDRCHVGAHVLDRER
ncbi:hypothetical protein G5714_005038 [Onychostoma macrolepis]|uniref:Uncharacterized protein n=1 Tax=Onychostoma macrolepis TaxID=369639 RepID=A0A7J6D719_9TELE|nr:hypothetical protein G5714_005038 [Onychostoma macrolepis]